MKHFYDNFFLVAIIYSIKATISGMLIRTIHRNILWSTMPYYLIVLQNRLCRCPAHVFRKATHPPESMRRTPA